MDEDLEQVEEILGIEDDEFEFECDGECDDCEDPCDYDYDDELIEVECPECGEIVCFYDEMLDEDDLFLFFLVDADTVELNFEQNVFHPAAASLKAPAVLPFGDAPRCGIFVATS